MKREEHICIISCITDETVTDITDENVTNDEAGMRAARATLCLMYCSALLLTFSEL